MMVDCFLEVSSHSTPMSGNDRTDLPNSRVFLNTKWRLKRREEDKLMHNITAKVATMAKSQLIPILQSCHHEPIHSQGHYKLNVRKADYTLL